MLSDYERQALAEIEAWKQRPPGPAERMVARLTKALSWIPVDKALRDPAVSEKISAKVHQLAGAATWTLSESGVRRSYRRQGIELDELSDTVDLPLEKMDAATKRLHAFYKRTASTSGASAALGATGAAAMRAVSLAIADAFAVLGLSMRAIVDYGRHYGFDFDDDRERLYAANVLTVGVAPDQAQKTVALAQLKHAQMLVLAGPLTTAQVATSPFHTMIAGVLKTTGIQTTRTRVAMLVPAFGIVAGAGTNRVQLEKVCEAARNSYRERAIERRSARALTPA